MPDLCFFDFLFFLLKKMFFNLNKKTGAVTQTQNELHENFWDTLEMAWDRFGDALGPVM